MRGSSGRPRALSSTGAPVTDDLEIARPKRRRGHHVVAATTVAKVPLLVVGAVVGVVVVLMTRWSGEAQAHETAPARGAPLEDLVPASAVAAVALALLVLLGWAHRRGHVHVLDRLGAHSARVSGLPPWAALPMSVATVSVLLAVFGFYWDVSWHIDRGRDPGPLANPAHWFIILGLAGVALAGTLSLLLGEERPTRASVRLGAHWHAPVGGVLLTVCGVIALAGFPLDDVWHRIFGQDVTLWGPTHIQMIGGASLATLAMWALYAEGTRERHATPTGWGRALDLRGAVRGRVPARPVDAASRVRLRPAAVPPALPAGARRDRGVDRARRRADPGGPRRGDRGRPLLPGPPGGPDDHHRPGPRPQHAAPPPLPGGSARGRGRGLGADDAPAAHVRRRGRGGGRHGGLRRGVGMEPRVDAVAVDHVAAPRGGGAHRRRRHRAPARDEVSGAAPPRTRP